MLVPRFVHGLTRDVKKESLRRIRLMKRGARWSEAMADELVDVATLPGLVVVNGPGVLMGFDPQTHIYSPFFWGWRTCLDWYYSRDPHDTRYQDALHTIFLDAVRTPWGVLGMIADWHWTLNSTHHWPYVQAVERHWDELVAIGDRFTTGSTTPMPLWYLMDSPAKSLFALGFPPDEYEALSPQGFHALYRRLLEVRAAQGLPPPPGEAP